MSKKILIIEDHDEIRANIVEILEMASYNVIEADNGKTGVEMALSHIPDLILCDIMMPELDGYGVLHILDKNPESSGIPFIFLTAKAEHCDVRKGMELGADDYLIKPFDVGELLSAIDVKLRKKTAQQNLIKLNYTELKAMIVKTDGLGEFDQLVKGQKNREFKKNRIVYYDGDHGKGLYLITSGKVKTVKVSEDGRELMTGMFNAGEYIGLSAVLSDSCYSDTATALEDSQLRLIPTERLDSMLALYPEVGKKFIKLLSHANKEKEDQLLQVAYHSVRKKMASALIKLYLQLGENKHEFNIAREDLAAMACMATETVSRTLTDFKDERIIDRLGANITILNFDALSKMRN